jgi:hypothetical protein
MDSYKFLRWWQYVCHKDETKMWTQKVCYNNVCYNNVKIKIEKNHHQMRNLRIKCIKNFPIQDILFYFLKIPQFL